MSDYQGIFKRYEKKYLLTPQQYHQLKWLIAEYMKEDHYGTHTICNLYYDTDDFGLIRSSIDQPIYKEKLRVRSYGVPKANDPVFIEIKKKYKGIVYKRRVKMSPSELTRYMKERVTPDGNEQIFQEIDWFMKRYSLSPKVFIAYERTAYYGKEDSQLRITFDQNIRFREEELDLSKGTYGVLLTAPQQLLMEIKMPSAMPLWLSQILTHLEIYPTSFSKYGNCYKNYLIGHTYPLGGTRYA